MIISNTPQTNSHARHTRPKRHPIRTTVALQPIRTLSLAPGQNRAMPVINPAIDQVEDIPRDHRRERHATPVLAEASDAEGFGDERGVNTEKEAVGEASEAGDEAEEVGVLDAGTAELGAAEDEGGGKEAPEAGHGEFLDDEVGTGAWGEIVRFIDSEMKAFPRLLRDRDLPLQRRPMKLRTERIETCINCRSCTKRGEALSS